MIIINFKKMKKSELVKNIIESKIIDFTEKFKKLKTRKIHVTVETENSKSQPGPDLYSVQLCVKSGKDSTLVLKKKSQNLYEAVADMMEHLLERLNREGDKKRVKKLKKARFFRNEVMKNSA